mgnify:CR=1 FL=1|jgi:hypothetical protein
MPRTGTDDIVEALKEAGEPVTLEAWLNFAYFGDPPQYEDLSQEEVDAIPPDLVKQYLVRSATRQ